ncbi:MAG: S41 family peptidase [Alphaproteobacteria bacterium]
MFSLKKIIILFIFSSFSFTASIAGIDFDQKNQETLKYLDLFGDVFDKIKKDYVTDPSDKDLIEAALNGMLTSLDPHSSYMNEKTFKEMSIHTKGEFGGLGIEVIMENGLVKVISPIEGTPAYEAKIKSGDYIISINDEPVMGMSLKDAVDKMRGKIGEKIRLTVIRENTNEPLEFNLIREKIKIKATRSKNEGDIAYLKLNSFSELLAEEAKTEIENMKRLLGSNIKGLILDLRNNPGGLLMQGIAVADLFLDTGEIVSTRGRSKEDLVRYNATKGDLIKNLPMVVLINGGSASASEIVAGALQDHKRAIILGTKSFGKGSVQTVIPISDMGAISITTSRYYTPSGRSIQAEGIVPDIIVEPIKIEYPEAKDPKKIYSEANLKKHLLNEKKEIIDKSSKDVLIVNTKNLKNDEPNIVEKDYQLVRAIDLLKAINIFKKE